MARFEAVLRYSNGDSGHEYVFATTRRENGAASERDNMVRLTLDNMRDHAHDGRVVQGSSETDPNAVVCALLVPDGPTVWRTVTFRPVVRDVPDDGLEDALLASLIALA